MPAKYNFISRKLSDYESVLDILNHHGDGIICHVMVLKSRRCITADAITNAFKWLVHYQPALRMCVMTENGPHGLSKRFVEMKNTRNIPITQLYPDNENWDTLLEEECARPLYANGGPLWKVFFLEVPKKVFMDMHNGDTIHTYGLVFKASHVITDHISIHNMLSKQLLTLLEQTPDFSGLEQFRTPLFIKPSVDLCFATARKNLTDVLASKKKSKKRTVEKSTNPSLGISQEFSFASENTPQERLTHTRVFINALTGTDTDNLLRMCRKHNVAPQEALTVAAMYAFHLTTQAKNLPIEGSGIRICHWLDLRSFHSASTHGDPLGMWMCPVFTKHKIPKRQLTMYRFWSQVKKLAATLRPEEEPWKRTFREYHNIMEEVNKHDLETLEDISIPQAHVAVSFLNARGQNAKGVIPASKRSSAKRSSGTPSTRTLRFSTRSGDTVCETPTSSEPTKLLAIDEYHMTSSVAPQSVSPLNLAVVLNQTSASCSLSVDGTKVPRRFAQSFHGVFCRVVSSVVTTASKSRHSSVIDKLPPYVRARIMTKTPGSSKI